MRLIVVTGQTATGKTAYALKLAQELNGELINCDSRQIYKHLDIITGKGLPDHTFTVAHRLNNFDIGYYDYKLSATSYKLWLYDIADPKQYFSSFDYQQCAIKVIKDIISRGKAPILVGGTYFYIQHLLYDIETHHIPPDQNLRKTLETKSVHALQKLLIEKNSALFESLNNSERSNPQRLIRKIEIASSNQIVSVRPADKPLELTLPQKVGHHDLTIEITGFKHATKEALRDVITKRVGERLKQGALKEVKDLLDRGYIADDPGLHTIGYQQLVPFVQQGRVGRGLQSVTEEWITKELQYAKRQLTFMKKDPYLIWKER